MGDDFVPMCDNAHDLGFDMPFVRMSPIPRRAGEHTRKESYLVDYDEGAYASKLRVELYYNAEDPLKAVRGVDVALVHLPGATSRSNSNVSGELLAQSGSVADGTATVTLQNHEAKPVLSGLVRRSSGTATLE